MKRNHEKIIRLLGDCINQCSYDEVLADTKRNLKAVLEAVQKIAAKRGRHEAARQHMETEAKKKQQLWWEMVKRNAANQAKDDNPDIMM